MVDYREIIRLKSAGYSNTSVASSSGSGRNKVAEVWKRAKEKNISWPIPSTLTNEDLKMILYPELQDSSLRMLPDYERVSMLRWQNQVTKCRLTGSAIR